ncbi:HemK2/MTQ2 family protein methyltransferase [Natronomonas amylolytica]|uniref:HemK2/MTQ2 family protein methyltransferase n=1 Tax=Natronomonas amylolytica TaxID=3108498 RepID=UPI003008E531
MTLSDRREMPTVYEPAEDSRLLADAVVDRIDADERVLEVGTGSGYVAARIAEETGARVVGSDINPEACRRAREEGIEAVRGNLTDPFARDSFDVVCFNPPYLPTPPEEEWDDPLEHALSGGEDGRRVIRPFLADVGRILRPAGRVYLLVSTLTDIDAVAELADDAGMETREIAEESFPFERLVTLEITHKNT